MNSKDKDYLDAKFDPLYQSMKEQTEWLKSNTRRINELDEKVAATRWHDWAVKGGIVGVVGLVMEALARVIHK